MKCFIRPALLLIALCSPLTSLGVVYTLRPGGNVADVKMILSPKKVLTEKVTVNGAKGTMEVGYSNKTMAELLRDLAPVLKGFEPAKAQSSVIIDIPSGNLLLRYFVMSTGKENRTVIFRMKIPKAGLNDSPGKFWPRELPRPQAGKVQQVMQLHSRNGTYATYLESGKPGMVYYQYALQLKASGWIKVSSSGNGGTYMSKDKKYLVIVNAKGDSGMATTAVYLRRIVK